MAEGRRTTMPAKMISEMPLPMPFSEICSPSHMMSAVPAVRVIIVSSRKPQPGSGTMGGAARARMLSSPIAMPSDCTSESDDGAVAGVLGDLLPARLALLGQPLQGGDDDREELQDDRGRDVRHDPEREDRSRRRLPPEKRSTMPSSVPCTWSKNWASASPSMPGVGTWAPSR